MTDFCEHEKLIGKLGTSISRDCFRVMAVIATFVVRSRC